LSTLIPNSFKKYLLDQALSGADLYVMLLTSSHSTNIDTQEFIDDVSGNEITGTGYTAGGVQVAGVVTSQDNTNNEGVLDSNDLSWTSSTFTARYAVLYDNTGTPSTSRIWAIFDLGSDRTVDGGTFLAQIAAEGLINLT
jgi:hypothetical protein